MGKGSLKTKQDRLYRLVSVLKSDDFWTTHSLCKNLKISHRTLMRDLNELRDQGYPIKSDRGRGGGINLIGRWGIDRLSLSGIEAMSMILSLAIVESLNSPILTKNLSTLRQKIAFSFNDEQRTQVNTLRKRVFIGTKASEKILNTYQDPKRLIFELLIKCFFEHKKVLIKYISEKGEATDRTIEPQILLLNWPIWYFLCWDELKNDVRMFRADRIINAEILNQRFKLKNKESLMLGLEDYFSSI